jgi:hypothetical protein
MIWYSTGQKVLIKDHSDVNWNNVPAEVEYVARSVMFTCVSPRTEIVLKSFTPNRHSITFK